MSKQTPPPEAPPTPTKTRFKPSSVTQAVAKIEQVLAGMELHDIRRVLRYLEDGLPVHEMPDDYHAPTSPNGQAEPTK